MTLPLLSRYTVDEKGSEESHEAFQKINEATQVLEDFIRAAVLMLSVEVKSGQ